MDSRNKGFYYEGIAREYLIKNGFRIVFSNFYTHFGEIDIIVEDCNNDSDSSSEFEEFAKKYSLFGSDVIKEKIEYDKNKQGGKNPIDNTIRFIEVKSSIYPKSSLENQITNTKRKHLMMTALEFLRQNSKYNDYHKVFDLIFIDINSGKLEHIKSAIDFSDIDAGDDINDNIYQDNDDEYDD